jgi:hypothetical protein
MRPPLFFAAVLLGVLAYRAGAADVNLDGFTSKTPKGWVEEEPSNKMRFAQFRLPRAKDDKDREDAELIIFKGLGGSAEANVDRWKKQFVPPTGKKIEDVAKVEKIKIAGESADKLTVEGTYLHNPQPFNPKSKTERRADYKMIAIHFEGPKDIYHIKLTGPAKTVDQHARGLEEWLKGFKK